MLFTQHLNNFNCIVVLGVTASGKTNFACKLAHELNGSIISADSRQVYKQLTIGTGKDLNEYNINGNKINYYGIDVCDADKQFYLHNFCDLLLLSFNKITNDNKLPIICGGTGLYLDALVKNFELTQIPENYIIRSELKNKSKDDLIKLLANYNFENTLHVDKNSIKRLIRGIEVAEYLKSNTITKSILPYKPIYFGIKVNANESENLIKTRLISRLNNGLIEEVETLLKNNISFDRLLQLGLEYKFIAMYLQSKIDYQSLIIQLQTAIIKYSKRQLTWFKKMEKEGVIINWIEKENLTSVTLNNIINSIKKAKPIN
ncbi:MAG: tRNA (adenosine(37)-N6)-dimethylallyltransferase MiaA [Bacteroidetes bacterium]|nr:tRNA (adenosine(37)-N6)-dimethylallyltransferase MiaA [Bacteroidota bacterium]